MDVCKNRSSGRHLTGKYCIDIKQGNSPFSTTVIESRVTVIIRVRVSVVLSSCFYNTCVQQLT